MCVSFRRKTSTFSLCTVAHKAQVQQCILICFFFWFSVSFWRNIFLASPPTECWRCFPAPFLLAVCDPSPYGFDSQCEKYSQPIPTTSTSSTKALERWEDKHARLLIVSYTNLGSHTLPNNQFGRTFGSDAFQFEWSLTGRSGITEGIPGFTYPGCQRLFMGGFRFRSSL